MLARFGLPRQFVLATAALVLVALSTAVVAIHEDEQGLRDWVMRFAGNVRHAAVPPVANPALVYVLSEEGAVSALDVSPRGALNLTWRQTFSNAPQCLAAAAAAVVTVDANGAVYMLNPSSGFIETTFLLQRTAGASATAEAVACSVVKDTATVTMYDKHSGNVRVYRFDITADDEVIPLSSTVAVGGDVAYIRVGGTQSLWASTESGRTKSFDLSSGSMLSEAEGLSGFVGYDGEFVLVKEDGLAVKEAKKDISAVDCRRCSATHIIDPATGGAWTGEDKNIVTVTTGEDDNMQVKFPTGQVVLPFNASVGIAYPLLAFAAGDEGVVYALIKKPSRHLVLVKSDGTTVWERREGLSGVAATLIVAPLNTHLDRFHFNKQVLLASRYGTLYSIPLSEMGTKIEVILDFTRELLHKVDAPSMADVTVKKIDRVSDTVVAIRCKYNGLTAIVFVDLLAKRVTEVLTFNEAIVVEPTYTISRDLALQGSLSHSQLFVYIANMTAGSLEGYSVSNTTKRATPAWSLKLPYPIVAHTSGQDLGRSAVVNELRVFPNNTGAEPVEEVRRRYPTRNVIAVAYYEPATEDSLPTLVITAIDAVTGSILATTRHENVEGDVKMVIVEHAVIYYFMDASKMRYCFGVWEMFQQEHGQAVSKSAGATLPMIIASFFVKTDRVFSSRATLPPVVVASTLGVFGGPIVDMGVTTSNGAIARKSVVLAFATGRVAVVDVRQLLVGGQMPVPNVENKKISHVIIPSVNFATHRLRIAKPQRVTTEPTNLESSCHILVTGLDLFYVRSSPGKPFDLLNTDFNKPLLVTLVCGFAVVSFIVRYLVMRKSLNSMWT